MRLGRPVRVVVVGVSGSGKTTLAGALSRAYDVPHVELDALWHDPGWTNPAEAEFVRRVRAATAGPEWVVDGNYRAARPAVWSRASQVVWLDLARWVAPYRAARRTAGRLVTGQELWNGNRERWQTLLQPDHPLRWSWSSAPRLRREYAELGAAGGPPVIRLRRPDAVDWWLREVCGDAAR